MTSPSPQLPVSPDLRTESSDTAGAIQLVSTEKQRRALEEMSQRLLHEFNNMVLLQEERARKFVAHSHSLSSLPQVLPAVAAGTKAAVAEAVKRREPELPTPPPLAVETTSPEREIYTSSRRLRTSPEEKEPPKEQSRFGFWSMIFIWILIILAIRTCS